jgi:adenylate cyclase
MNSSEFFRRLGLGALLPLAAVIAGLGIYQADPAPVQSLRNAIFDQYQRLSPRTYLDAPVRVADIDDESLARLGQWPWPRLQLAALVDTLRENGAAAVIFDVTFPERDRTSPDSVRKVWKGSAGLNAELDRLPDHDELFAQSIGKGGVVLGFALTPDTSTSLLSTDTYTVSELGGSPLEFLYSFKGSVASLPDLQKAAAGNGAFTFVADTDGIVRRVPLFQSLNKQIVPSLSAEALRVAQQGDTYEIDTLDISGGGVQRVTIGEFSIPTTSHAEVWLHYTRPVPQRTLPVWKILAGEIPRDQIEDRIVLIGTSAQGLMDLRFSPLGGSFPGVEAHAMALEQIIGGEFLQRPDWATGLEIILLVMGGLLIGAIALHTPALVSALLATLVLGGFAWGGWYLFSAKHLLLDTTVPSMTVLFSFMLTSVYRHVSAELRQRWVKQAFSRYVSPNLVAYLVDHPESLQLGGRRQECSFIFTDLAGFTNLMEKIDPTEAVGLLNHYLDEMIAIAFKHEGTLDRIVGDAVAVIFSAPVEQADHRAKAFNCALEMQEYSNRYMIEANARGIAFGMTRIGVHSGEVTVGNFGGSTIFDYRALGDPINTAARLESVNKQLGTQMCVSEATLSGCPGAVARPVGKLVLKGKSLPLMVYQPVSEPDPEYAAAYRLMADEKPEARAVFEALAQARPDDPLPKFHLNRFNNGQSGEVIVFTQK